MNNTNYRALSVALLLLVSQVLAHAGHNHGAKQTEPSTLMCYVCEDCASISKDTPLQECNAEYFASGGSTLPATMTTAKPTIATDPTTDESVTMSTTEVTQPSTTPTTAATTTTPKTTISTEAPMPTPPTTGPEQTTPSVPTPPLEGTVATMPSNDFGGDVFKLVNRTVISLTDNEATKPITTTNAPTTTTTTTANGTLEVIGSRKRRDAGDLTQFNPYYTYHCYSVKKTKGNNTITERGCSRVTTEEGVCSLLVKENNDTKLSKCYPCTKALCNASGALNASLATLLIAIVAAALRHT